VAQLPQSTSSPAIAEQRMDARALFTKGQTALQAGDLDVAEAAFRQVLSVDPRAGSAYANLGVIAMRRKEWDAQSRCCEKPRSSNQEWRGSG